MIWCRQCCKHAGWVSEPLAACALHQRVPSLSPGTKRQLDGNSPANESASADAPFFVQPLDLLFRVLLHPLPVVVEDLRIFSETTLVACGLPPRLHLPPQLTCNLLILRLFRHIPRLVRIRSQIVQLLLRALIGMNRCSSSSPCPSGPISSTIGQRMFGCFAARFEPCGAITSVATSRSSRIGAASTKRAFTGHPF